MWKHRYYFNRIDSQVDDDEKGVVRNGNGNGDNNNNDSGNRNNNDNDKSNDNVTHNDNNKENDNDKRYGFGGTMHRLHDVGARCL